jgi:hypothetical protein
MGRRPTARGDAWIEQVFRAGQVAQGNIVRRSIHSVARYASTTALENATRRRGYHMALIGEQYVILCNSTGQINVIC